ncbi:MMPL family transporter [Paenibacillus chungangensis]|uniref:MMPL family transporter n=1 Tax=Paenibacillus chungangensis TaxID=696535 RepID=A0ABW3HQ14_9BACL
MLERIGGSITGPKGRWITILVWIAAAVLLTLTLPAVGDEEKNNAPNLLPDSPSVVADEMMNRYFPNASGVPALLVWHRADGLTEQDYSYTQQLTTKLMNEPLESQGELIPLDRMPLPALISLASEDGTTFVQPISFQEGTETELLKHNLEKLQTMVQEITGADPFAADIGDGSQLSARISGPVGIFVDATALFQNADFVLLLATVILVLVLLLVIYRSPILAVIPLIGVGFAYLVTSPLLGVLASEGWITVDSQAIAIMTVLLFGAGTDYCLFFITRFRQELTLVESRREAMRRSFKGASGAIAMSGFTVVIALLALLAAHFGAYDRFAVPFSLSILIMGIASLTLVPALLAVFGRASFFPFIPRTEEQAERRAAQRGQAYRRPNPEKKLGMKIGKLVITRPWTVIVTTVLLLGVLAGFAPSINYSYDLLSGFPEDMPSREGFATIGEAFPQGELAPVTVMVKAEEGRENVAEALRGVSLVAEADDAVQSTVDEAYASYRVILDTNPYSLEAMETIPKLRAAASEALGQGGEEGTADLVWIAGATAQQYDDKTLQDRDNRVIIPLVIGLIMLLLLLYLRSVTATLYLVATVLLSYAAALGLGWIILHHLMGYDSIQGSIPLYAFVFLIALGEDYNIFMISSIWQKRKRMPLLQAIKEGVSDTGGVITSAGLILAGTFAVLASLPLQVLVQFGLITAIGVLMDTFIVRPFLVPAITAVLGRWAFWPAKEKNMESGARTETAKR